MGHSGGHLDPEFEGEKHYSIGNIGQSGHLGDMSIKDLAGQYLVLSTEKAPSEFQDDIVTEGKR